MEKIIGILKEGGFTEKESLVYVTLLSLGATSAYAVAEKSGLKAPTTYLTLQNLMHKNLAYLIPRAKKKLFAARDPREVVADLEKRAERAQAALKDMLALIPEDKPRIKIHYYQGIKGMEEALGYGMKHHLPIKEVVGFFASAEKASPAYIDLSKKYIHMLKKRGVKIRGLTPDHISIREIQGISEMLGHELRTIPYEDYSANASIEVEGKIVRIVLHKEEKAIIIDNAELAHMVKQIFEMVWKK
jgi:predicted transcriptional regulator